MPMKRFLWPYVVAALTMLPILLLIVTIRSQFEETPPFFFFLVAVMFSARYGGLGPGLFATFLAVLASVYFLQPPLYSFTIADPEEIVTTSLLGWAGVIITLFNQAFRQIESRVVAERIKREELLKEILERKRVEAALRESEAQLKLAQHAAHAGAWDWDMQTNKARWSEETYYLLGLHPGDCEPSYENWLKVVHPNDRDRAREEYSEAKNYPQGSVDLEYRIIHPDGTLRWMNARGQIFYDKDARPSRMVGITMDITERKKMEAALQAREEQIRLITDSLPALISYVDVECRYRLNSRAYEHWFGHPRTEITGKHVQEVLGEEAWAVIGPYMKEALSGKPVHYEREVPYKEPGTRWISAYYVPHFDAEGKVQGIAVLVNDITERKRAEEALKEADHRKDEFLATLAHELRNPLASLYNAVQILRLKGAHDPEWSLDMAERQVRHLTRLVDDLLDISRITQGKITLQKKLVDLAAIAAQVVEATRPDAGAHHHTLTVTLPPEPLYLEGDEVRLAQIIGNLLNNAIKYSEEGRYIGLTLEWVDKEAVLRVRDTGMGIPKEALPHIFDLFTQVERGLDHTQGGLGIGLSLAKSLTEMHGGCIEAYSEGLDQGSEFVVRLPLLEREMKSIATSNARPLEGTRRTLRVLVVDDDIDVATSVAMFLNLCGHEVRTAHEGEAALEACRTYQPEVVVLDISLPGMNGYEVARRLRQEYGQNSLSLIAMTGHDQAKDRERALAAGFNHHLVKPTDLDTLLTLLESS